MISSKYQKKNMGMHSLWGNSHTTSYRWSLTSTFHIQSLQSMANKICPLCNTGWCQQTANISRCQPAAQVIPPASHDNLRPHRRKLSARSFYARVTTLHFFQPALFRFIFSWPRQSASAIGWMDCFFFVLPYPTIVEANRRCNDSDERHVPYAQASFLLGQGGRIHVCICLIHGCMVSVRSSFQHGRASFVGGPEQVILKF